MDEIVKATLILGLLLIVPSALAAQAEEPKESPWSGDISMGLSLSRGNSDTSNVSFTINASHQLRDSIEWLHSGFFLFGRVGDITNTETYQLSTRVNWKHTERLFSYYEILGVRDRFKNYSYQILPGVGAGYQVVKHERITLSLSAGLTEIINKFYDSGETASYLGFTLGDKLVWKISESAELNQKLEWNFDSSQPEHFLARWEASLITTLIKSWSVKLTVINRHDSRPVGEGIKKNDFSFLAGISKKF
jgi:putative salt-induced outer membrane protein